MLDPVLTEALSRLDAWLLEVCAHEEARAHRLNPAPATGWASVRDLIRPSTPALIFGEGRADDAVRSGPERPLVPPGEHPLNRAQGAFGLAPVEAEALLVLLSIYLEPRYRALYAVLVDNPQQGWVTDQLLLTVLGVTAERRMTLLRSLGRAGRLVDTGLVQVMPGTHAPLGTPFDLAPDVREALLGLPAPPGVEALTVEAAEPGEHAPPPFSVVFGPGEWREDAARLLDAATPRGAVLGAPADDAPSALAAGRALFRLAGLGGALGVLDVTGLETGADRAVAAELLRLVQTWGGRALVLARQPLSLAAPQRPARTISFRERRRAWEDEAARRGAALPDGAAVRLASSFRLGPSGIQQAFAAAFGPHETALAEAAARLTQVPVRHGILARTERTFADLVVRETTRAGLERLVHYTLHRDRLSEELGLETRFRLRHGPIALFSGRSGTGKTLAAEVVAHALRRPLYVVELSQLVSKYIGETEKNIEQVLSEAERAGVVLFFDEADALFSARTEVTTSNDRYANLEVGYLLQRIERHDGLVVLATNLRHSIDEAFLRRFQFRIEFPFPELVERRAIWERMIPPAVRTSDDFDLEALSRDHRLSGGEIRNAALKAVFLAEQRGARLSQGHLEQAIALELLEMGRLARRPPDPAEGERPLDRGALLRHFVEALERLLEGHLRERFLKEIHLVHGAPTKEALAGKKPSVSVALYRIAAPKSGVLRLGVILSTWSHRPDEEHELLGVVHDALLAHTIDAPPGYKVTLRVQESYDFDMLHRFWSSHGHPVRASVVVDGEMTPVEAVARGRAAP